MFPIYIKDQQPLPEPTDTVYFVLAQGGVYLVKRTPLYEAVTPYHGELPGLPPQQPQLQLHLPKLPQSLVERVVGFFVQVFERYGTEAVVVLFYASSRGFYVDAPPQRVNRWHTAYGCHGGYRVRYASCPRPAGFLQVGTVHSHADLPASHSHVDALDEQHQDGLHLTVGDVTRARPSFSAAFVANGHRFHLPVEDVLAGFERPTLPAPAAWMAQVRCRTYWTYDWGVVNHHPWRGDDDTPAAGDWQDYGS